MFAVSTTETDVEEGGEPLRRLPLTTERPAEGQPDSIHALTVLDWNRGRWNGGTWFRTLRSGTRSRDRRLDTADGPPRRLASGAVTACRVAGITMLARERPDTPATEACPEEDIRLLLTLLSVQGHREHPCLESSPDPAFFRLFCGFSRVPCPAVPDLSTAFPTGGAVRARRRARRGDPGRPEGDSFPRRTDAVRPAVRRRPPSGPPTSGGRGEGRWRSRPARP